MSVIIPARNEEANLPRLLTSLRGCAHLPFEICVVDDASTDRTGELAREQGARVIAPGALPEGWTGKAWACFQGAKAATGDILFFVDADAQFEPDGFARALAIALQGESHALSVLPYHRVEKLYEEASFFFNLLMAAGSGGFAFPSGRFGVRLVGPSLVIPKSLYFSVGGHETVRGHILENFHFSKVLSEAGISLEVVSGRGLLSFRMFPEGFRQLRLGWIKAFADGAAATPPRLLAFSVFWLVGAMSACTILAGALALCGPNGWIALGALFYAGYALQLRAFSREFGSFSWLSALFYPIPFAIYVALFGASTWKRLRGERVEWRGRRVGGRPGAT